MQHRNSYSFIKFLLVSLKFNFPAIILASVGVHCVYCNCLLFVVGSVRVGTRPTHDRIVNLMSYTDSLSILAIALWELLSILTQSVYVTQNCISIILLINHIPSHRQIVLFGYLRNDTTGYGYNRSVTNHNITQQSRYYVLFCWLYHGFL